MRHVLTRFRPLLRTSLSAAGLVLLGSFAAIASIDNVRANSFASQDARLSELPSEDLEDLLVFVGGNALFAAYHEAGHMLVSELSIPVLGQEEDAVDNLATLSMLAADNDETDLLLINAMIGWFLVASFGSDDLIFYGEHDLDEQRGYRILCLMVGADEDAFLDLARDLDLPEERIETCAFDYEQTADSWEAVTDPYLREGNTPAGRIKVVHDAAPSGLESVALFLREAEILEQVADELDTFYNLPEPVTFRASSCGVENAFWDPDTREVILCHEFLGGLAELYLADLTFDN
ncbi:DUF4344 domain-containing metallopeptidase [Roseibium alexandrii]